MAAVQGDDGRVAAGEPKVAESPAKFGSHLVCQWLTVLQLPPPAAVHTPLIGTAV